MNKWKKPKLQRIYLVVLLGLIIVAYNQCVINQYEGGTRRAPSGAVTPSKQVTTGDNTQDDDVPVPQDDTVETGATEVAVTAVSTGVKNFEQIYSSFSIVTGINVANESSIRNVYNQLSTQLPTGNEIKSYASTNQIAIIKLAAEFCQVLFEKSAYYTMIYPTNEMNVAQSSTTFFAMFSKNAFTQKMINQFWGVGTQEDSVINDALLSSSSLIDEILQAETTVNQNTTRKVAKAVCTSLLSSGPVIFL